MIKHFKYLLVLALVVFMGCKKKAVLETTNSGLNITTYLNNNPEQFSEFSKMLSISGSASFLNAYGGYTLFAPNNAGIATYLLKIGKTSIDQLDPASVSLIVKHHLLKDTIGTTRFTDGKLPTPTFYGQYLITGASNVDGVTKTRINRQANLVQGDIVVGNGIIHVIDNVLEYATITVAQVIESNPKYSIYTRALKETTWYDSLNVPVAVGLDPNKKFVTFIAETDSVLRLSGINSFEDLKTKYSQTGDPRLKEDSLNTYVAYHIIPGLKYLVDIISTPSHTTLAPFEVITDVRNGELVILNQDTYLGMVEPGAPLNRDRSDATASNGVIHSAEKDFAIKSRQPTRVDWDIADFPEIRKLPSYFRKEGAYYGWNLVADPNPLKDITWQVTKLPFGPGYQCSRTATQTSFALYNDVLALPLGGPNRPTYYSFTTPIVVRGTYKVWACYRQITAGKATVLNQVLIDSVPLPNLLDFSSQRPGGSDAELEAQGWKQYTANNSTVYPGRLLGVVNIKRTERHIFRINSVTNTRGENYLDLIQFIPIDQDQVFPRFKPNGDLVFPD